MDARITKQRLVNMLSYDWLKILGAIALAALFFVTFFLMIGVRPTDGQKFYVYSYDGVSAGREFSRLSDAMEAEHVFGYDILDTGSESFEKSGIYGDSVFTARRSAGEGRVMFVRDVRTAEDGKVTSDLLTFISYEGTEREAFSIFLDPEVFLNDCRAYLEPFFGEELAGEINRDKARETFLARNKNDARFRSSSKKEEGVNQEVARLEKLKEDYLLVSSSVGEGKLLSYVTYETEIKTHTIAFSMEKLNLTSLVYHTQEKEGETVQTNSGIALCIFNNNEREGDLKYETVNFLAYLLKAYGVEQ